MSGVCNTVARDLDTVIELCSSKYDVRHSGWSAQCQDLQRQLQKSGIANRRDLSVAGDKGGAVEIIAALGAAGAIQVLAQIAYLWLRGDSTRSLKLRRARSGDFELVLHDVNSRTEVDIADAIRAFCEKSKDESIPSE